MGVKKASILSSCGTTPTASLDCFLYLSISKPHIHTFPEVFITAPEIILIKVDFPAPLGPSKPNILPTGTFKDISFKAILLNLSL